MVRIVDPDLRICASARFTRKLEGADPRDVRLECQHLEIEHQPGMIRVSRRNAEWPIKRRQLRFRRLSLGLLDAPLDLAHAVEIMVDLRPVSWPEAGPQAGD